jgi:hypothetical protein
VLSVLSSVRQELGVQLTTLQRRDTREVDGRLDPREPRAERVLEQAQRLRLRELACLRHLLRLAAEWGHTEKAPRIRLSKEPEHRVRWLEPNEETALLVACKESRNAYLVDLVRVAL